jgi:triacylglycerol lipase
LTALPPARRRLMLTLLVTACVAALVIVTLIVVAATAGRRSSAQPVSEEKPGPVLLIPGYGGSVTGLQTLANRLRATGKQVQIVNLPDGGTGDLRSQAGTLASAARAAAKRANATSVDVVGYSAGGVVARLWVHDYGGAKLARRVVTLGSPQHGTELASLGALLSVACPTACQQLTANSELLAALNGAGEKPSGPQFVSIWTTRDEVVVPPDSARLSGALNITVQSVCASSTVQHSGLPTDPVVGAMVIAELAAGQPVPLTSTDCARLSS